VSAVLLQLLLLLLRLLQRAVEVAELNHVKVPAGAYQLELVAPAAAAAAAAAVAAVRMTAVFLAQCSLMLVLL
jgi:hypothetical protein